MVTSHLHILYLCFAHSLSSHYCSARHPTCQHSDFLVVARTHCVHHAGTSDQLTLATTTNWNKPPKTLRGKFDYFTLVGQYHIV